MKPSHGGAAGRHERGRAGALANLASVPSREFGVGAEKKGQIHSRSKRRMLAPVVVVLIIILLAASLIAQRNRARHTRGALLRAIEAEARAEQALAERALAAATAQAQEDAAAKGTVDHRRAGYL
jgi:hypothetical protein